MSEQGEVQPIIIKRKKGGHGGHHGGSWKVAFADFMTSMMAFFLVMWLVGQKQEVKEAVAGYFRDPGKFFHEGRSGVLKGTQSALPANDPTIGLHNANASNEALPSQKEQQELSLAAKNILNELEKQEVFQRLKKNVSIQLTSEGLRIILNESADGAAFFEPGSSKLLQKSAVILMVIAKELGNLKNRLVMEGHTDNAYTASGEYSNWELSADRANAARQLMEVSGLHEGQVREVRGYADQFPMISGSPSDPRNRRVTILVLYEAKEKTYDQVQVDGDQIDLFGG
ncbi:flagellar motor protein MotB [candidate division GN15 bacterium]|uniref:Flagellar motor protein MotB n=1 Tax=candidate division GN15 bacterium TaxID=2072418 RepID=A0A855X8N3_9BACT|nr:MAG: flagellar motor protein MotB [candidate division GN15 bacterium]